MSGGRFTISSLLDSNEDNNRRAAQPLSPQQLSQQPPQPQPQPQPQLQPQQQPHHQLSLPSHLSVQVIPSRSASPDPRRNQATGVASGPTFQRPILVESKDEDIIVIDDDVVPGLGPPKRRTTKKKNPTLTPRTQITNTPIIIPHKPLGQTLPVLVPRPPSNIQPSASPTPSFLARATTPSGISDQIRLFQTSFKLQPTPTPQSRTSINSIINIEDTPEQTPQPDSNTTTSTTTAAGTAISVVTPAPKKKRAPRRKKEDGAPDPKKRKTEEGKDGEKKKVVRRKKTPDPDSTTAGTTAATATDKEGKAATPVVDSKDGTSDASALTNAPATGPAVSTTTGAATPAPPVVPTITTERNPVSELVHPPLPSVIEVEEPKPSEPPIIALNIPLLDPNNPKPGQSQVVINVLKLTEEKYGWAVMHPNAKSAIDLMDDMIDDEEDAADEEDEDATTNTTAVTTTTEKDDEGENKTKKKKEDAEELTEEQLVRQHEVKMNRKVGKYDYEDPFIDDEELQWEEEITSTKEGFFVYWGPLVDDRLSTSKKAGSKGKK